MSRAVGLMIRQHRLAAGASQKQLADWLGVSQATVSGWEAGRYEPSFSLAAEMSRILDIDPGAWVSVAGNLDGTLGASAHGDVMIEVMGHLRGGPTDHEAHADWALDLNRHAGEVAHIARQGDEKLLRRRVMQTAALCVSWLELAVWDTN